jgi:hypothetical protein
MTIKESMVHLDFLQFEGKVRYYQRLLRCGGLFVCSPIPFFTADCMGSFLLSLCLPVGQTGKGCSDFLQSERITANGITPFPKFDIPLNRQKDGFVL